MQPLKLLLLAHIASALNFVLSNDDGWAEINIRTLYNALTLTKGNSVIISAPAENESGTGSSDAPATPLLQAGEFGSIPLGAPAEGYNASMKRFNYVNSFPVTSMRYGIQTLSPQFFKRLPDLAIAGFNVGANSGPVVLLSGTVGATTEAAKEGIPAIAFSGTSGDQTAWNAPVPAYATVYAALSAKVVATLTSTGLPYMAPSTWVNVNFPASNSTQCSQASEFKFVFTRIMNATALDGADVVTCKNGGRLPTEDTILNLPGCYSSISVGNATTKLDVSAAEQAVVLRKLRKILTCAPAS